MKKIFLLLSIITLVIVTSCSESPEEYKQKLVVIHDSVNTEIFSCILLLEKYKLSYNSCIEKGIYLNPITFQKSNCGDDNKVLNRINDDISKNGIILQLITEHSDLLKRFKELKYNPEIYQNEYKKLDDLIKLYTKYVVLTTSPMGEFEEYNSKVEELGSKFYPQVGKLFKETNSNSK